MSRELQFLISLLEEEYEANNHTSLSAAIHHTINSTRSTPTNTELLQQLKTKYGPPCGNISRVVSKRLFNHLLRNQETVVEVISDASEYYDCNPQEVSDDMFCRYLETA